MFKLIIISIILLALASLLIGVRLIFGKSFVKTHVEDNRALRKQGVRCYRQLENEERHSKGIVIEP